MKKVIITILIIFSLIKASQAQHCGWDYASIIIVEVTDSQSGQLINGLNITLTDSAGYPYKSKWNMENYKNLKFYQGTDTLKFGQNSIKTGEKFSKVNGPFPFGLGCYMLIVYHNNYESFNKNGKDLIAIKDIDGNKNSGYFESAKIKFNKKNIAQLCTNYPLWRNQLYLDTIKIQVKLKPKYN